MTPIYRRNDVLQMIDDGRLDLTDFSKRRLSPLQVVIEKQNKSRFDLLTSPAGCEDDLIVDLILHYFTLPHYVSRLSIGPKRMRCVAARSYFAFIEAHLHEYFGASTSADRGQKKCLPAHSVHDWINHAKKHDTPNKIYLCSICMLQMLQIAMEHRYDKVSMWPDIPKAAYQLLKAKLPKQPPSTKKPPLGQYLGIPESEFTNRELQMGLRFGVIWLLQHIDGFRRAMLREKDIDEAVTSLEGLSLSDARKKFEQVCSYLNGGPRNKENHNLVRNSAAAAWKCIQADPLLTEWQFYSFKKLRSALIPDGVGISTPFLQHQQEILLKRFVNEEGELRPRPKGFGRHDVEWQPFKPFLGSAGRSQLGPHPCIWGTDWLVHTILEELLMQWMLASERCQKSGIERLTLDGVHLSDSGASLQISTLKLRRASNPHVRKSKIDVESSIYKRRTPPFEVYGNWLSLKRNAQVKLENHNVQSRFVESRVSGMICQAVHAQITKSYLPLELLSVPGTVWHGRFLADAGDEACREAQAFIAILRNRVSFKRNNPTQHAYLPVGPIGESLVVELELENNYQAQATGVESETAGHSQATGRMYKDGYARLGVTEIIEPVRTFARAVGNEKIQLAEKIASKLAESERTVSFEELQKICGIKSSMVDQAELLSLLDEQDKLTISGGILAGDETLVIETEMTAGMMWGYILHLEEQLPTLIVSNREETCTRYLAQLIHYHQLFESFGDELKTAGRLLAAETAFPFPSLT